MQKQMKAIVCLFMTLLSWGIARASDNKLISKKDSTQIELCVQALNARIEKNNMLREMGRMEEVSYIVDVREQILKDKYPIFYYEAVKTITQEVNSQPDMKNCINYYVIISNYVTTPGVDLSSQNILEAYEQNPGLFNDLVNGGIDNKTIKANLKNLQLFKDGLTADLITKHKQMLDEIHKRSKLSTVTEKGILQSLTYEFVSNKLDECYTFANISLDKRFLSGHQAIFKEEADKLQPKTKAHDAFFYPHAKAIKNTIEKFAQDNATHLVCETTVKKVVTVTDAAFSGNYLSPSGQIIGLPVGKHKIIASFQCGPLLAFQIYHTDRFVSYKATFGKDLSGGIVFNGFVDSTGAYYTNYVSDYSKGVYVINDFVIQDGSVVIPKLTHFSGAFLEDFNKNNIYFKGATGKYYLFAIKNPAVRTVSESGFINQDINNKYFSLINDISNLSPCQVCLGKNYAINVNTDLYYSQFSSNMVGLFDSPFRSGNKIISTTSYTPSNPWTASADDDEVVPKSKLSIKYDGMVYYDGAYIFLPTEMAGKALNFSINNDENKYTYTGFDWWLGVARPPEVTSRADDGSQLFMNAVRSRSNPSGNPIIMDNGSFAKLNVRAWDKTASPNGEYFDEIKEIRVVMPWLNITYFSRDPYNTDNDSRFVGNLSRNTSIVATAGEDIFVCYKIDISNASTEMLGSISNKIEVVFQDFDETQSAKTIVPSISSLKSCATIPSMVSSTIQEATFKTIRVMIRHKASGAILMEVPLVVRYLIREKLQDLKVTDQHSVDDYNKPKGRFGLHGDGKGLYVVTCPLPSDAGTGDSFSGPFVYDIITSGTQNTPEDRATMKVKWTAKDEYYDNIAFPEGTLAVRDIYISDKETAFKLTLNEDCDQKRLRWQSLTQYVNSPKILKRTVTAEVFDQTITTEIYFVFFDKRTKELELSGSVAAAVRKVKSIFNNLNAAVEAARDISGVFNGLDLLPEEVQGPLQREPLCKVVFYNKSFVESLKSSDVPISWESSFEEVENSHLYAEAHEMKAEIQIPAITCQKDWDVSPPPLKIIQKVGDFLGYEIGFKVELTAGVKIIPGLKYVLRYEKPTGSSLPSTTEVSGAAEGGVELAFVASGAIVEGAISTEVKAVGEVAYDFTENKWKGEVALDNMVVAGQIALKLTDKQQEDYKADVKKQQEAKRKQGDVEPLPDPEDAKPLFGPFKIEKKITNKWVIFKWGDE